jgi:hypothetical protein
MLYEVLARKKKCDKIPDCLFFLVLQSLTNFNSPIPVTFKIYDVPNAKLMMMKKIEIDQPTNKKIQIISWLVLLGLIVFWILILG